MREILLVAESIKNEISFIKFLRSITPKSISEIRENLRNKQPFFEEELDWDGEVEEKIKKILRFCKETGSSIRMFEDSTDNKNEISEEIFYNILNLAKRLAENRSMRTNLKLSMI